MRKTKYPARHAKWHSTHEGFAPNAAPAMWDETRTVSHACHVNCRLPPLDAAHVWSAAPATQKQDGYIQSAVPVTENPIHLLTAALLHSTLYIHTPHSTLHALDCTLHSPHSPFHALHRTFPTQHCTFFTLHTLHSTPFHIPQSTVHWCCNREKWKTAQDYLENFVSFTKVFCMTAFGFVGFSCFSAIRENKDLLSSFSFSETPRSLICSNIFTRVQQIRASSSQWLGE